MYIIALFVLGLGAIVGSFLNVVILRLGTGRSITHGRSRCARCDRTLSWYELIPLFSFVALRGACRTCKKPLSFQYPFIELITGLVFFFSFITAASRFGTGGIGWGAILLAVVSASLCIVIVVYDLRHKIIPNTMVYPLIALSLISVVFQVFVLNVSPQLFLAGPLLALPFFFLWFFSQGRAMGFGDVKLALALGWFAGVEGSIVVFFYSFLIGAVVGLLLMGLHKKYRLSSEIPFAPFLIIAYALLYFTNIALPLFSF